MGFGKVQNVPTGIKFVSVVGWSFKTRIMAAGGGRIPKFFIF